MVTKADPGRLVLVAIGLALWAFAGAQDDATARADSALDWEPCGGGWDCALLEVPLDYDQPAGETIEIAVTRRPAGDPDNRIGVLLANPGGPGGEGIDFARDWSRLLGTSITQRFDIVGFDPRGVSRSTPIVCHDTILDYTGMDPAPQTLTDFHAYVDAAEQFADDCMDRHADLIPHLGTKNAARDMDRIREALGEDELNYVGYSYGTRLGAVYADLFPERVRAFVLDGAVDLSLSPQESALGQARGFERALRNFIEDCEERDCALADEDDIYRAIQRVFERSRLDPIPAPGASRDARPGDVFLGMVMPLYNQMSWGMLESAIRDAIDGDGSLLVYLADLYLGRDNDSYTNRYEANIAINCADRPGGERVDTYDRYRDVLPVFREASPLLGGAFIVDQCIGWPTGSEPVGVPEAAEAPPIVVIGTTGDPATPYEWAEAMAEHLEPGVLLRHEGEGHTVYGVGSSRCVNSVVNDYLLELAVPDDGVTCAGGNDPVSPESAAANGAAADDESALATGEEGRAGPGWVAIVAVIAVTGAAGAIAVTGVVLWRRA